MARTSATVLIVGMILTAAAAHADEAATTTRVRSEHATITRLIAQATRQSTTFRREIEAINATDGLVYVHLAPCGGGVRACLVHTVELPGPYRLLRVKLDLGRSELETMAALGHELQHAIEDLSDAHVRSDAGISAFYRRLVPTDTHQFETPAALQAGLDVHDELIANAKERASGPRKIRPVGRLRSWSATDPRVQQRKMASNSMPRQSYTRPTLLALDQWHESQSNVVPLLRAQPPEFGLV